LLLPFWGETRMSVRTWITHGLASVAILGAWAASAAAQPPTGAAAAQPPTGAAAAGDKPLAVVNGVPITQAEVEAVLKRAGPKATAATEAQKRDLKQETLSVLIDDLLMKDFLRKKGPRVDLDEVNKQIAELTASLRKENKSLPVFLKEQGQTEAQLRDDITSWLQWNAFVKKEVSEADVKQYYMESKDFFDQVKVRASHIVLRISPEAPEADRAAVAAKLRALRQEIIERKIDFAEAAKKYSHCTSAPNGGDIGYFPRKLAVDEAFGKAAFAMKVGEVSDVVQTDFGMHLIKVTDRNNGTPSDFNKIKEQVRELCIEEVRMRILAEQRKAAVVEINNQP
jgi:parvulin-like peptidyl-prolyl isomerase